MISLVNEDFVDFLAALLETGTRFLVVGAHAMAAHGVVRATGDLDVWVEVDDNNTARLWRALEAFGAPIDSLGLSLEQLSESGMVWQIGLPPRRIDILTSIDGVAFDEAWTRRKEVDWEGLRIPILGVESLRRNKKATGREKDRLQHQRAREEAEILRRHGRIGRPLGSEGFVARLEKITARRLRPRKVGRKPQKK